MKSIIAAFHDRGNAEQAIAELRADEHHLANLELIDDDGDRARLRQMLDQRAAPEDRTDAYVEALRRGCAVVVADAGDADAEPIASILEQHEALDLDRAVERWRAEGWTRSETSAAPLDDDARAAERDRMRGESIDVVEEQVRVGKRAVPGEAVRVRAYVTERPFREEVALREEHVEVHREPADERISPAAADEAFTDQEFEVTTTAEEPVIEKQARVVERVNVGTEAETRTEAIEETERRRDVEFERAGEPRAPRAPTRR